MRSEGDIGPLVELALHALAERLGIDVGDLPTGVEVILRRYGESCYQKGEDDAFEIPTVRTPTDPQFLAASVPPPKDEPDRG